MTEKTQQGKIRRIYYIGSLLFVMAVAVAFSIPIYLNVRNEFQHKLDQLQTSVLQQKRILIKSIVEEKISDIVEFEKLLRRTAVTESENDFNLLFRNSVRELIHNTVLPDNGYIWINEILDYGGGDRYALRFVHPNLIDSEGEYLSTNTEDIQGNRPYFDELNGIKNAGEIYYDYYFKKKDSDIIAHKLSYSKLYRPYNWVVSTGVYLDDVDALIQSESAIMMNSSKKTIRQISMTILISILILGIFIVLFEIKLQRLITAYFTSLQDSKEELQSAYEKIKELAFTDHLTGLLNRRAMFQHLNDEMSRFLRQGGTFSLLMGDIDWFKSVNDSYGHDAGDFVLKELSGIIQESLRKEDKASRWGGEEFLCLVTNAGPEEARIVAEKLRKAVESHEFKQGAFSLSITMTLGISTALPDLTIDQLIEKADANLYRGKNRGRNMVVGP